MYANREPSQESPCDICRPEFRIDNIDAFRIYDLTKYQYIMSMNGAVDINHMAVWKAIEKYQVRNEKETFEKVLTLCRWNINYMVEKRES
jgi:hypothetical protein